MCPRCGNPNIKQVFLAGSTHETAEQRCDKCVKSVYPEDLKALRDEFNWTEPIAPIAEGPLTEYEDAEIIEEAIESEEEPKTEGYCGQEE